MGSRRIATAIALLALLAPGLAAARGIRPDPGFGGRGWVTLRVPGQDLSANAVALLPGGKIVITGQISPVNPPPTGDVQVFVAQYRANGRLDPSFARGGLFISHLPNSDGPARRSARFLYFRWRASEAVASRSLGVSR
ncbi:hypothetical protein AYO39_01510 [Actinobacteria bacterium SCGC AG-212-D09]|nr:hypothetical protein AYO39_01510 [Actinobacteria bacterium SCGC AG-212-D09]